MAEQLRVVDNSELRKEMLYLRPTPEFGRLIFLQNFWLPPMSQLVRHRHTGMTEVMGLIEGAEGDRMKLILEKHLGDQFPEEFVLARLADAITALPNILHTLRNFSQEEVKLYAMGIETQPGGQTIKE